MTDYMTDDAGYVVVSSQGMFFTGLGGMSNWDKQLRAAKVYHWRKMAAKTASRYPEEKCDIKTVRICIV